MTTKKGLLTLALSLGLVSLLGQNTGAFADLMDKAHAHVHNHNANCKLTRVIDAGNCGTIDLSDLDPVGPPFQLELIFVNDTDYPVNVDIPELQRSYLVDAHSMRKHSVSPLAIGYHQEVAYNCETIMPGPIHHVSNDSIQYILSPNYTTFHYAPEPVEEPVRTAPKSDNGVVRGYW